MKAEGRHLLALAPMKTSLVRLPNDSKGATRKAETSIQAAIVLLLFLAMVPSSWQCALVDVQLRVARDVFIFGRYRYIC
jgi:hypothetical protein